VLLRRQQEAVVPGVNGVAGIVSVVQRGQVAVREYAPRFYPGLQRGCCQRLYLHFAKKINFQIFGHLEGFYLSTTDHTPFGYAGCHRMEQQTARRGSSEHLSRFWGVRATARNATSINGNEGFYAATWNVVVVCKRVPVPCASALSNLCWISQPWLWIQSHSSNHGFGASVCTQPTGENRHVRSSTHPMDYWLRTRTHCRQTRRRSRNRARFRVGAEPLATPTPNRQTTLYGRCGWQWAHGSFQRVRATKFQTLGESTCRLVLATDGDGRPKRSPCHWQRMRMLGEPASKGCTAAETSRMGSLMRHSLTNLRLGVPNLVDTGVRWACALVISAGVTLCGVHPDSVAVGRASAAEGASDSIADFARTVGAAQPRTSIDRFGNPLLRRYVSTDGAAVLRWSLPLPEDSPFWEIQRQLEQVDVELSLRGSFRRGLREALKSARQALAALQRERLDILLDVGREQVVVDTLRRTEQEITHLVESLEQLNALGPGSTQPTIRSVAAAVRAEASASRSGALAELARLEEASIRRVPFRIPRRYDDEARLRGRALVRLYLEAPKTTAGARPARSDTGQTRGTPAPCVLQVVVDGWNAPLTSGNFVRRVLAHEYDGMPLIAEEQGSFVFFSEAANDGKPADTEHLLPLEILLEGEPAPLYGESIDTAMVATQRQPPVLPVGPFGTLAMAHSTEDVNDAQRAFYIFTFDKRSLAANNPTGNAFTGTVAVFGYLPDASSLQCLANLHPGYRIRTAELVYGRERYFGNAAEEARVLGPAGSFPDEMRLALLERRQPET